MEEKKKYDFSIPDTTIMPFGKFKGIELANVPAKYLLFLYNTKTLFGELKQYCKENEALLMKEAEDG